MRIEENFLWERSSGNAHRELGFMAGTEAHIWYASSEASESILSYYGVLSDEEKVRVERLHKLEDQRNYVVGQGLKRLVLSAYAGCHPKEIEFEYNQYGKPLLSDPNATIMFNVAHSKNIVLLAVSRGAEIGIDVEYVNSALDWSAIASNFFSADELQHLEPYTGDEKTSLFYTCWTQKEARLKALGLGLFGMKAPNLEQDITTMDYNIVSFGIADRYQGALAVSQMVRSVRLYACHERSRLQI